MKIDVFNGKLSIEFHGDMMNFNIYDVLQYPSDVSYLNFVDFIEPLTEEFV